MRLQAACPSVDAAPAPAGGASHAHAAAALSAFVRAAAAEAPSCNWSCTLLDAAASAPNSQLPALQDAYGSAAAASRESGPLLTEALATQPSHVNSELSPSSDPGKTLITGGLGGLGSTAAAALAAASGDAAAQHLVLLGRSGRAASSNACLQAFRFGFNNGSGLQCVH